MDTILLTCEEKMEKSIASLERDFGTIRAGRANASVLDRIAVDYYGVPTPINQMAAISDASTLKEIEKAINKSDIGINPMNDGKVIRLAFPPLTEERRRELAKEVRKMSEDGKVAIRSIRRDAIEKIKALRKANEITEDDQAAGEKDVQELTDKFCKDIDVRTEKKEKEILEI